MKLLLQLFLCLSFILSSGFAHAQNNPRFIEQVQKLSELAMHKRQGLVIWTSLETEQRQVFGNSAWLQEKFLAGSLFKLLLAQAAVENGVDLSYSCKGHDFIGGTKRQCWTYKGHGKLDLARALALSCNLYFENLSQHLGLEKILSVMRTYPSLRTLALQTSENPPADLALFGIGDDRNYLLTPNDISVFWNSFVKVIQQQRYAGIYQGLKRSARMGTASKLKSSDLEILAKTGTGGSLNSNYKTNGWLVAAYPAKAPHYTLLILLQEAHGFQEPASLAEKIFSKLKEFEVGKGK